MTLLFHTEVGKLCRMQKKRKARKARETMTAKEFARRMSVNYRTVLNWLRNGLVPNAEEKDLPIGGSYWEIPSSALSMTRPKRGPQPKKEGAVK